MIKANHTIGATLLVAGTTIGAAMLAVPLTCGFMGFWPSLLLFIICWGFMLCSAFFFIDVNCAYQDETNIITMAGRTLNGFGRTIGWVFYMLLLYALVAAYISASGPIFAEAIQYITGLILPHWIQPFLLPILFGSFIYFGTLGVDLINRLLMLGLLLSYLVLVVFVPPHIDLSKLAHVDFKLGLIGVPVVITSFGYHIIIPSLATYLKHDKKELRKVVILGSLITLVIYIFWQILVLGVVPVKGEISLAQSWLSGSASSATPLAALLHQKWVKIGAHFFSFFAIVTSFLGVSLSLSDFLIDGLKIKKTWEGKLGACLLTFVPPLIFVFTYQRGFLIALEYAGAFVAILLIFLPAAMAWTLKKPIFYQKLRGRALLMIVIAFAASIVVIDILNSRGFFNEALKNYLD